MQRAEVQMIKARAEVLSSAVHKLATVNESITEEGIRPLAETCRLLALDLLLTISRAFDTKLEK